MRHGFGQEKKVKNSKSHHGFLFSDASRIATLGIGRPPPSSGTGKKDADERRNPRQVTKQSVAAVVVQLDRAIGMEVYADTRALGRFMLRREGETIAVGVVTKILA